MTIFLFDPLNVGLQTTTPSLKVSSLLHSGVMVKYPEVLKLKHIVTFTMLTMVMDLSVELPHELWRQIIIL